MTLADRVSAFATRVGVEIKAVRSEAANALGLKANAFNPAFTGTPTGITATHVGAVAVTLYDAKGDLIVGTTDNTGGKLGVGANDTVLMADNTTATGLKWGTVSGGGGIAPTLLDAKGDLIVASANDTAARLPVGSDGQFLQAASIQATGLQWVFPGALMAEIGPTFAGTDASYPDGRSYQFAATAASGYPASGSLSGLRSGVNHVQRLQGWTNGMTQARFWSGAAWSSWSPYLDSDDVTSIKAGIPGVALHGAVASFPRPTGYAIVIWLGSVTPTNMVTNDLYFQTA